MTDLPNIPDGDDPLKADVQKALAAAFGEEALAWLDEDDDFDAGEIATAAEEASVTDVEAETVSSLGDLMSELGAAIEGSSVSGLDADGLISDDEEEAVDVGPRYVVFEVGEQQYGIPIDGVLEIDRCGKVTSLPRTPVWLRGVTNLRGQILSVTDFRELLGLSDQRRSMAEKIIVVHSNHHNARTALVVDRVLGIRHLKNENGTLEGLSDRLSVFAEGLAITEQSSTVLIDPDLLLGSNELSAFIAD